MGLASEAIHNAADKRKGTSTMTTETLPVSPGGDEHIPDDMRKTTVVDDDEVDWK